VFSVPSVVSGFSLRHLSFDVFKSLG